jgi:uncharacterized protein (DUF2141 family)
MVITLFIHLITFLFSITPIKGSGLHVKVTGIKSNQGKIILGVFKDDGNFPTIGKQYKGYRLEIKDKKAGIHITDLPKGTYAIGVCHDLNSNEKMDKNVIGYPLEPYGFSNNVKAYFSQPTFQEAQFYFDGSLSLEIRIE